MHCGFGCPHQCGLRDGTAKYGQFYIDTQLAFALKGDVKRGLFFSASEPLPFGKAIRPVQDLIDYLLSGVMPNMHGHPAADSVNSISRNSL